MKWKTNRNIKNKPYWYADCLDVDRRPLWIAIIEPFGKDRYVLKFRIAGYNFENCYYYDSLNYAKSAFEQYIESTAFCMLKQVGRVRKP